MAVQHHEVTFRGTCSAASPVPAARQTATGASRIGDTFESCRCCCCCRRLPFVGYFQIARQGVSFVLQRGDRRDEAGLPFAQALLFGAVSFIHSRGGHIKSKWQR